MEFKTNIDTATQEYIKTLNNQFSFIVSHINKFQLCKHDLLSVQNGHDIVNMGVYALKNIKTHIKALENVLSDCQDFIKEIEDDLSQPQKEDGFVFHTKNGMLSYKGRDFIQAVRKSLNDSKKQDLNKQDLNKYTDKQDLNKQDLNKYTDKQDLNKQDLKQDTYIIPNFTPNYKVKIPYVDSLKKIPPMFHYYDGDEVNPKGMYCCLTKGVYAQVPFPDVIDPVKDHEKHRSVKCKYETKEECNYQRNKIAKHYNSQLRQCNFAHKGENLVKVGNSAKCSFIPNFGNRETLLNDIKKVCLDDIKTVLLYGLHDVAISAFWFHNKPESITLIDLDKA